MLHVGRVGSTVICDMLKQHLEIHSLGEIWNRKHSRLHLSAGFNDYVRSRDPYRPLKRQMLRHSRLKLVFEIKFLPEHHLKMLADDIEQYVHAVTRLGVTKFILLERRNLLRRAVSGQILRRSGISHVKSGQEFQTPKILLDLEAVPLGHAFVPLETFFERIRDGYAEARRATSEWPTLELVYEEDVMSDPRVAYKKCCAFIGVEPAEIEPRLARTNPQPLTEILENCAEVARALENTHNEWMLTAP